MSTRYPVHQMVHNTLKYCCTSGNNAGRSGGSCAEIVRASWAVSNDVVGPLLAVAAGRQGND